MTSFLRQTPRGVLRLAERYQWPPERTERLRHQLAEVERGSAQRIDCMAGDIPVYVKVWYGL